jgi:hypothetical protein
MRLVTYKYRQKETISTMERTSDETIYDSAMHSFLRAGELSNRRLREEAIALPPEK